MISICIGVFIILCILLKFLDDTDVAKIPGLSQSSGWPIFGSLFEIGENHSAAFSRLAETLGSVFQIRLGNRRIVVANSYQSIKELWIKNQSSLISRPVQYTFDTIVGGSDGYTIGTSPWDESCKQRRKAVISALNKSCVQSYMSIVDFECSSAISKVLEDSVQKAADIDITHHLQRAALNMTVRLNCGTRISSSSDKLLSEIFEVESAITQIRSSANVWEDYVPLLRIFSRTSERFSSYRRRQGLYIENLLDGLMQDLASGIENPCIMGSILKDPSTKLNQTEIKSVCLSLVGAGFDTIFANIAFGIGYLSSSPGQDIQERAYDEIRRAYSSGEAWGKCVLEEQVPYVTALCKEILRYYTVVPMALGRQSVEEIDYNGMTIPAGTWFYMNAFAGDYDTEQFEEPLAFNPERYLQNATGMPHYAYGAGSRMCPAANLSNRILFVFFIRLIVTFRILPPVNKEHAMILNAAEANCSTSGLVAKPKPFKCRFEIRDREVLTRSLQSSMEKSGHH